MKIKSKLPVEITKKELENILTREIISRKLNIVTGTLGEELFNDAFQNEVCNLQLNYLLSDNSITEEEYVNIKKLSINLKLAILKQYE